MTKTRDYQPLLDTFRPGKPGESKPRTKGSRRHGEYRINPKCQLPSWERLLAIDAAAEAAAKQRAVPATRVAQDERPPADATPLEHVFPKNRVNS